MSRLIISLKTHYKPHFFGGLTEAYNESGLYSPKFSNKNQEFLVLKRKSSIVRGILRPEQIIRGRSQKMGPIITVDFLF